MEVIVHNQYFLDTLVVTGPDQRLAIQSDDALRRVADRALLFEYAWLHT